MRQSAVRCHCAFGALPLRLYRIPRYSFCTWDRSSFIAKRTSLMQTVVHVTHEAIQKIGGIGAVLQGLLTSNVYLQHCKRNILVGPFWPSDERGEQRLGPNGEVLYSSMDSLYRSPLAAAFREIEQTYQVGIVYGRRKFIDKETGVISVPEIL